jgi:FKBP-type peptidyl-prolyl cis-trans isomerase
MKKFLSAATAALLLTGMASCSGNSDTTSTENADSTEATTPDYGQQIKDNKTLGREFMEQNAKNDSVVQTPSGLQYMVLKEGNGAKPGPTDEVTVHYTGRLIDGTVFDSSVDRGEPSTFTLDKVIPGWTEGLQLMSEGSEYRLFIPSELAYGSKGAGQQILPNSTLIFDVQLIKVNKKN